CPTTIAAQILQESELLFPSLLSSSSTGASPAPLLPYLLSSFPCCPCSSPSLSLFRFDVQPPPCPATLLQAVAVTALLQSSRRGRSRPCRRLRLLPGVPACRSRPPAPPLLCA
uniref:Uncharacterized protein n=1 Tax=Triticum urartu TaxID=4572 RepID=A0A8R7PMF4_TRIUA